MNRRVLLAHASAAALTGSLARAQPLPVISDVAPPRTGPGPLWPMGGPSVPAGATLDLSFLTPGTLDPRITFTRASTATYFNSAGVMQTAAVNLALSSGDLTNATYWTAPGAGVTITVGPDLSPDGVTHMSRFSETAPDTVHYVSSLTFVTTVASQMYTASCYAKAGQTRYLQMILDDGTNGGFVTFDLQAGVISGALTARGTGAIGTAAIQAVGNGIYRCSLSATNPATTTRMAWVLSNSGNPGYAPDYPGNPANGLSVWGVQLEAGAFPTSYIPTTSTPNGAPRWDYNPSTLALNGLLIEEARTNIITASNAIGTAPWVLQDQGAGPPVLVSNVAVAPDGTMTASQISFPQVLNTTNNGSTVKQPKAATAAAYCETVWLKGAIGGETVWLFTNPGTTVFFSQLCTLTTQWQRYTLVTGTLSGSNWGMGIGVFLKDPAQFATPAQTIFAWGAQMELGAFPTSYIGTLAAAVTRAQDRCSIAPANMGGWGYVEPGGSWQVEFISNYLAVTYSRVVSALNGPDTYGPILYGPGPMFGVAYDGTIIATSNVLTGPGAVTKIASSASATISQVCLNGGPVSSAANSGGRYVLNVQGIALMQWPAVVSAENVTGYLRRVRYWPRVLTNAEMQQVTT